MKLLVFFEIGIVLGNTFQCKLLSRLDKLWIGDILLLKHFDLLRIGSAEKRNLGLVHEVHDHLNYRIEVLGQKFVDFIQHKKIAVF